MLNGALGFLAFWLAASGICLLLPEPGNHRDNSASPMGNHHFHLWAKVKIHAGRGDNFRYNRHYCRCRLLPGNITYTLVAVFG